MMTPWNRNILDHFRNSIRFCLWGCLALNCLMASIFSICWVYAFLTHLWRYCLRTIFGSDW